jgi:hypothetical protein
MKFLLTIESLNDYKKWKRDNVTYRGLSNDTTVNNRSSMLGRGLYTVPASNKSFAKQYGKVYFVVNGKPKNPKVFNDLNRWEIFLYNEILCDYDYDVRNFEKVSNIETEIQKMGYDGVLIKGREMVNYTPADVKYFATEDELIKYFNSYVLRS